MLNLINKNYDVYTKLLSVNKYRSGNVIRIKKRGTLDIKTKGSAKIVY